MQKQHTLYKASNIRMKWRRQNIDTLPMSISQSWRHWCTREKIFYFLWKQENMGNFKSAAQPARWTHPWMGMSNNCLVKVSGHLLTSKSETHRNTIWSNGKSFPEWKVSYGFKIESDRLNAAIAVETASLYSRHPPWAPWALDCSEFSKRYNWEIYAWNRCHAKCIN